MGEPLTLDMESLSDTCEWDNVKRPTGSHFTITAADEFTLNAYRQFFVLQGTAKVVEAEAAPPPETPKPNRRR